MEATHDEWAIARAADLVASGRVADLYGACQTAHVEQGCTDESHPSNTYAEAATLSEQYREYFGTYGDPERKRIFPEPAKGFNVGAIVAALREYVERKKARLAEQADRQDRAKALLQVAAELNAAFGLTPGRATALSIEPKSGPASAVYAASRNGKLTVMIEPRESLTREQAEGILAFVAGLLGEGMRPDA